jgi:xanthine dehydrogenase YagR molybdenum-binding subunit
MEMNSPVGSNALDVAAQGVVGKPLDRVDGRLKVSGGARYAYEMQQAGALYGFVVEASIGKGMIKAIDTRAAEKSPGVVFVLTHRNAPEQGAGDHREAHPVLTGPEVTRYGEPVAFVVAESFEQARAAAYLVDVKYDRSSGKYALRNNLKEARVPPAEGRSAGRQRNRRFRRRVRQRSGADRRDLHHAPPESRDDGAPCDARDVGG